VVSIHASDGGLRCKAFLQVKGGKGTATRTVGLLGGIFAFAVRHKLRADNPVRQAADRIAKAAEAGLAGLAEKAAKVVSIR
jgi:hypothetical protein